MSERKKIEDRLRKKQAEIQALESKIVAARVYVNALQDVLKLLDGDSEPSEAKLKPGSGTAQARDIILERREPVHLDDILRALGKDVTRETKASLTSSLAAYARRGEIFVRTAPNTFGLVELGHDVAEETEPEPMPPSGFGGAPRRGPSPFDADLDEDVPF